MDSPRKSRKARVKVSPGAAEGKTTKRMADRRISARAEAADRTVREIEKGNYNAAPGRILKPMVSVRGKSAKEAEERRMRTNALTRMAYHENPERVRDRKKREYHRNKIRELCKGMRAADLRTIVKAVNATSPAKAARITNRGELVDVLCAAVDERGLEAKNVRAHLRIGKAARDPSARRPRKSRKSDFAGTEMDGHQPGGGGEGPNHRRLKEELAKRPSHIDHDLRAKDAEPEYKLLSGDQVDVLVNTTEATFAIEVKSRDSNDADLERGVYQCVKYRAVLEAEGAARTAPQVLSVEAWLVVERGRPNRRRLPKRLDDLARRLGVRTRELDPLS